MGRGVRISDTSGVAESTFEPIYEKRFDLIMCNTLTRFPLPFFFIVSLSLLQLVSFGSSDHAGSIFINVPFANYQDKRLCLEATPSAGAKANQETEGPETLASSAGLVKGKVVAKDCDDSAPLQRFLFEHID